MNRANQQALFQQTNQGLLGIRQSEVNYYHSLNVAFGTQAALIGGFTYGVFTQNEVNYDNGYIIEDIIADFYWIVSAITIALSVHVILCTMLMQVLGPGLALNGPVGSMARATEGMRLEQQQIIVSFVAMMFTFSAATVLSCWVVMSFEASLGCSVSFLVAARYWYKYCERIYLRFYWNHEEAGWKRGAESVDSQCEEEIAAKQIAFTMASTYTPKQSPVNKSMKARKGFFQTLFGTKTNKSEDGERSDVCSSFGSSAHSLKMLRTVTSNTVDSEVPTGTANSSSRVSLGTSGRKAVMEGYLTKRGGNGQKFLNRSEPWERRYFTLTSAGNLYIYKNRHEYRNNPKHPIYTRPLRLSDYYVEVNNFDDELRADNMSGMSGRKSEGGLQKSLFTVSSFTVPDDSEIKPFRFQMTLILREHVDGVVQVNDSGVSSRTLSANTQSRYRDHWVLRCDTEEELQHWVHMMQDLCPSSSHSINL